jgi:hypothetical protein
MYSEHIPRNKELVESSKDLHAIARGLADQYNKSDKVSTAFCKIKFDTLEKSGKYNSKELKAMRNKYSNKINPSERTDPNIIINAFNKLNENSMLKFLSTIGISVPPSQAEYDKKIPSDETNINKDKTALINAYDAYIDIFSNFNGMNDDFTKYAKFLLFEFLRDTGKNIQVREYDKLFDNIRVIKDDSNAGYDKTFKEGTFKMFMNEYCKLSYEVREEAMESLFEDFIEEQKTTKGGSPRALAKKLKKSMKPGASKKRRTYKRVTRRK